MKRFICFTMVVALLMSVFTGCGKKETAEKDLPMAISQEDWADAKQYVELSTGIKMAYVEMGGPGWPGNYSSARHDG